jgi:tetratricopeptide (TPR) repeat protein
MRPTRIGMLLAVFAATPALAQPRGTPEAAPAAPAAAAAPEAGPSAVDLEKAKQRFAHGKERFDKKDYAGAVEDFKESYRLSKNPVLLYNVGFTLDQLGQRALALFYYQKFVAAVPADNANVAPARERITALQKDIEDASLGGAPVPAAATATPTPNGAPANPAPAAGADGSKSVSAFEHKLIDSAPPGKPIDIGAFVPEGGYQVALFYRAAGEAKFTSVDMKPRYNERVGRIPAAKTRAAPTVQYYIEVRDPNGQIVDRSGKSTSPNLVFLEKTALPHYYADLGDDRSYHEDSEVAAAPTYAGGAVEPSTRSNGGWLDTSSTRFGYLKWGTTWTTVGMLALSGTFYFIASDAASSLEDEASSSSSDECPSGPPCRAFSKKQRDLEARGERFENLSKISLGVGATAAVAAGVFWYLDLKDRRAGRSSQRASLGHDESPLTAAPVVSPDYVGGAALLRF